MTVHGICPGREELAYRDTKCAQAGATGRTGGGRSSQSHRAHSRVRRRPVATLNEQDSPGARMQIRARTRKSTAGISTRRSSATRRATSAPEAARSASMASAAPAEARRGPGSGLVPPTQIPGQRLRRSPSSATTKKIGRGMTASRHDHCGRTPAGGARLTLKPGPLSSSLGVGSQWERTKRESFRIGHAARESGAPCASTPTVRAC